MANEERAGEEVEGLTPAAERVGAIKKRVKEDGYLRSYNTEGTFHIRAIKESGYDMRGRTSGWLVPGGADPPMSVRATIEAIKE
ncbi:hypothetical protein [Salmonella enterica]|uniref:hypothetical protein n=1 Tax=Salmonella enterica TaxID=28901 RepID=UPI00398C2C70